MKIVELDQRSDEWHKWRRNGIGASEAACLMGEAYNNKTPYQLWEEKCGFTEANVFFSHAMEHGVKAEPIALARANSHIGANCRPVCVEDELTPYLRASLDGWDPDDSILLEIKCPISDTILDNARKGHLPTMWVIQLQWQMMIVRPRKAYFAIWDHRVDGVMVYEQYEDPGLMEELKERAHKFWEGVRLGKAPPLTDGDYEVKEGEEIRAAVEKFKKLSEEKRKITLLCDEAKEALTSYSDGQNFKAYGVKVSLAPGRVTYNVEQMRIDGIDLEPYTKRGKGFYRVSIPKSK